MSDKNVKLLMVATGPVIAEVVGENAQQIIVKNPCQILQDEEGNPTICDYLSYLPDHKTPTIFYVSSVISVNDVNPMLLKEYEEVVKENTSQILVPSQKIIV